MKHLAFVLLAMCAVSETSSAAAATATPLKKAPKVVASKTVRKPSRATAVKSKSVAASRSASSTRSGSARRSVRSGAKATASTQNRAVAASQPAPERLKEIQQSLADRGYYKGDINGQWSADSQDALRRFQKDQNLAPDGKLNSLALIALGLGPKRSLSAQAAPPPPGQSSVPPSVQR